MRDSPSVKINAEQWLSFWKILTLLLAQLDQFNSVLLSSVMRLVQLNNALMGSATPMLHLIDSFPETERVSAQEKVIARLLSIRTPDDPVRIVNAMTTIVQALPTSQRMAGLELLLPRMELILENRELAIRVHNIPVEVNIGGLNIYVPDFIITDMQTTKVYLQIADFLSHFPVPERLAALKNIVRQPDSIVDLRNIIAIVPQPDRLKVLKALITHFPFDRHPLKDFRLLIKQLFPPIFSNDAAELISRLIPFASYSTTILLTLGLFPLIDSRGIINLLTFKKRAIPHTYYDIITKLPAAQRKIAFLILLKNSKYLDEIHHFLIAKGFNLKNLEFINQYNFIFKTLNVLLPNLETEDCLYGPPSEPNPILNQLLLYSQNIPAKVFNIIRIEPFATEFANLIAATIKSNEGLDKETFNLALLCVPPTIQTKFSLLHDLFPAGITENQAIRLESILHFADSHMTNMMLGDLYSGKLDDWCINFEEAEKRYHAIDAFSPYYEEAQLALGQMYLGLERYSDALIALREAADGNNESAEVARNLLIPLSQGRRTILSQSIFKAPTIMAQAPAPESLAIVPYSPPQFSL